MEFLKLLLKLVFTADLFNFSLLAAMCIDTTLQKYKVGLNLNLTASKFFCAMHTCALTQW